MDHSTITAQLNTDAGSPTFTSFGSPITIQMTENIRANDSHIVTHGGGFTIGTVSLEAGKAIRHPDSSKGGRGDPSRNRVCPHLAW